MKYDISLIIPFLNEADNINNLVKKLSNYFSTVNISAEIIFVDDGSTDDSVRLLLEKKHQNYQYKIIKLSKNFGSHEALRAGILNSSSSNIMFMYADLQDPLFLIDKMYAKLIDGNDIVWGTREKTEYSFFDNLFSKTYNKMMKKLANPDFPESGFDIVIFNKKIKNLLNNNIESNSSIFLQILNFGFKQSTIFYNKTSREFGKSKWTFTKKVKLAIDSFIAFTYAPIRLVTITGILFALIGFIWGGVLLGYYFSGEKFLEGWMTLISVLFIGFGITNISLGIIAEYLWRTLDVSRNRDVFIIDEIIDDIK